MSRFVSRSFVIAVVLMFAACVQGVSGPSLVRNGSSATFTGLFLAAGSATNATGYAYVDLPAGWSFQQGSYTGTVNGQPASGAVTLAPSDPGVCVLPPPAPGQQRIVLQAGPFASVLTGDSVVGSATFLAAGAPGPATIQVRGASSTGLCQGQPTQATPPPSGAIFGFNVAEAIPAFGTIAAGALLLALAFFAARKLRTR